METLSAVQVDQVEPSAVLPQTSAPRIWIDLDNSPHVPLFMPIIDELQKLGHPLLLTARDCFQVTDLVKMLHLECRTIGRHNGKNKVLKLMGLGIRAIKMVPTVLASKPSLAVSHGSRAQLITASLMKIPTLTIMDYEFVTGWALVRPTWVMVPEVIPESCIDLDPTHVLRYPGIKEDVYVPRFKPDTGLRAQLGIGPDDILVTLRPPATEAHYHVAQSDVLFSAAVRFLAQVPNVRMVILPRNKKQANQTRTTWGELCASRKLIVQDTVVDGLNLIWHSDLVISGGGTMNREAAALGVPVYSTFRGKTGAVDRYLAASGRLTLLEDPKEIPEKLRLIRQRRTENPRNANTEALRCIVNNITCLAHAQFKP